MNQGKVGVSTFVHLLKAWPWANWTQELAAVRMLCIRSHHKGSSKLNEPIEIREILSTQLKEYKMFLTTALSEDGGNLIVTSSDNLNAPFPTKDRNDSFTLGAYSKNVLAGVASFAREDKEKLSHKGLLFTMYVSTGFRGHGIAKQLLGEIIKKVKTVLDIEQINLIVISDNVRAKRLYEKFGFKKYGTELNSIKWDGKYFSEDLMVLRLR